MWTLHSPHVHATCLTSGSRGYVILQGVARPLRNAHSLSFPKTRSGRRSYHLPSPSWLAGSTLLKSDQLLESFSWEDTWLGTKINLLVWLIEPYKYGHGTIHSAPTSIAFEVSLTRDELSLTWDEVILGLGPRGLSLTWEAKPVCMTSSVRHPSPGLGVKFLTC